MATRKASCNCGNLSVTLEGSDPQRVTLCSCYECQRRTGSVLSVQARIPREQATIDGESKAWTFPVKGAKPATFRSCDSGGTTYHFCPECGSTVYWDLATAPEVVGVAVGSFADPTFPTPIGSGFEAYGHPWTLNIADLPIHLEYGDSSTNE